MEIVVFLKFSSGNIITFYITVKTIMFQSENVPTGGKPGGEVRMKAENTTQYPISTLGRVDGC